MNIDYYQIVLYTFYVSGGIQLLYFLLVFPRVAFHKVKPIEQKVFPPVSIVICAKNEEKNLMNLIPLIFQQDYKEFEVVVVNDGSWDDTQYILEAFEKKYDNLHIVQLHDEDSRKGKKLALTVGIKGAKYDTLLLTDADCKPNSNNWIKSMVGEMKGDKEIVLGYSPMEKEKGFLNKLIRFETFQNGLMYLSMAKAGMPYMGVGRNLLYKKELFFNNSGFKSHYHILSGDDDLFINEVATRKNTSVNISKEGFTYSYAPSALKKWWHQKKRHFTTAPKYRFHHKLILGLFPVSYLFFLLSFCLILGDSDLQIIGFIGIAARYLIQFLIFILSMGKMGDKGLVIFAPFFELFLHLIYPIVYMSNYFEKPTRWR